MTGSRDPSDPAWIRPCILSCTDLVVRICPNLLPTLTNTRRMKRCNLAYRANVANSERMSNIFIPEHIRLCVCVCVCVCVYIYKHALLCYKLPYAVN